MPGNRWSRELFHGESRQDLSELCAHLTISAEVGVSSKEVVNSMRSELLDLPERGSTY